MQREIFLWAFVFRSQEKIMKKYLPLTLFAFITCLSGADGWTQDIHTENVSEAGGGPQPASLPKFTYEQKVALIRQALIAQKEANERLKGRLAGIREILAGDPCKNPKAALELKYAGSLPPVPPVEEVWHALKKDNAATLVTPVPPPASKRNAPEEHPE